MSSTKKANSAYYAALHAECEECKKPFVQPDKIPLDYARPFHPFPFGFEPYPFDIAVPWTWIPFVFDRNFFLTLSAVLCGIIFIILFIVFTTQGFNPAAIIFAILFGLASSVCTWARINAARNENHRRALCYLYAKKKQATKLWAEHGATQQMYSKDVFYETSTFQGEFRVLRDGTVEIVPSPTYEGEDSPLQASVVPNTEAQIDLSSSAGLPVSVKLSQ